MPNDLDFHYCEICREDIPYLKWEDHEEWHREESLKGGNKMETDVSDLTDEQLISRLIFIDSACPLTHEHWTLLREVYERMKGKGRVMTHAS